MVSRRWLLSTLLILVPSAVAPARACFTVIVGRDASADGSVLVGHNEQNGGRQALHFRRVPGRRFDEGAVVRLRRGGTLEQVPETFSFLWSELPGQEFSDSYLNEHGVAVVSNACPTRQDDYAALVARGEIRDGGIGYTLRRLVAQRARSAREGVLLAAGWVERFGYVHCGRTYVIADTREAWLLAVAGGRAYVAQRVPDDAVAVLPNIHIIGVLPDHNSAAWQGIYDYAGGRGWWDPHAGPFNFRKAFRRDRSDPPDPRRLRGRELVLGRKEPRRAHPAPIGVNPPRTLSVADVAAILRDRAGRPPLSTPTTQEASVFQLRAGVPPEIGCVWWRTTAEPAVSVFTPWYLGVLTVPEQYDSPGDLETKLTLDHHFNPPEGTFDRQAPVAWRTFRRLQDVAYAGGENGIRKLQDEWTAFERKVFAVQPELETKAIEIWEKDPEEARRLLTERCHDVARDAQRAARKWLDARQFGSRQEDGGQENLLVRHFLVRKSKRE